MSNQENWKKHISAKLRPYLELVDRKYIGLTEEEKEYRKAILSEKQVNDNFILRKQKKKDFIKDHMQRGKEVMNHKRMTNGEKSKQLHILHKVLMKAGSTKIAMEYLLHSIQYEESYRGKQDPVIINRYHHYYNLLDNETYRRRANKENIKKMLSKNK